EICKNRCCSATRQQHVFSVEFFSGAVEISLLRRCRRFFFSIARPLCRILSLSPLSRSTDLRRGV
ncbi:hypothetical protein ACLOJK_027366, partial [Asimina triloba]